MQRLVMLALVSRAGAGQLGHLLVVPVETPKADDSDDASHLLLLALNADATVPWDELKLKVCICSPLAPDLPTKHPPPPPSL